MSAVRAGRPPGEGTPGGVSAELSAVAADLSAVRAGRHGLRAAPRRCRDVPQARRLTTPLSAQDATACEQPRGGAATSPQARRLAIPVVESNAPAGATPHQSANADSFPYDSLRAGFAGCSLVCTPAGSYQGEAMRTRECPQFCHSERSEESCRLSCILRPSCLPL